MVLDRVGHERIAYLPHDAYYKDLSDLPPNQRVTINFDHPNSLDTELLIQHVLQLKDYQPVDLPVYDFKTHIRTSEFTHDRAKPVIMVEGILIFAETALRESSRCEGVCRYRLRHSLYPPPGARYPGARPYDRDGRAPVPGNCAPDAPGIC